MCNYCNAPIYIKTVQYAKSLIAPMTEEQALRDRLLDLTGEIYIEIPKRFCPICGKEVGEKDE